MSSMLTTSAENEISQASAILSRRIQSHESLNYLAISRPNSWPLELSQGLTTCGIVALESAMIVQSEPSAKQGESKLVSRNGTMRT